MTHRTLYPALEPFHQEWLSVSDGHQLYIEQAGNPHGKPLVFLHGGPGSNITSRHRQLFDPSAYRIILFDQRGAGQSKPHASLENNTTWHLVADIEAIRAHLGIPQWLVFGGSWGSTLALAYAQTHPEAVCGLILRGIFLCRPEEIDWFYQHGAHWLFPDEFARYAAVIPPAERSRMIHAFYARLTDPDPAIHMPAAKAWSHWEGATCKLLPSLDVIGAFEADAHALALARIECHYFVNGCWFERPDQLLANAHRLAHIPTWLIHGRYDVVCPVKNATDLAEAMPHAQLHIIPDAGHAFDEPGILSALLNASDAALSQCVWRTPAEAGAPC